MWVNETFWVFKHWHDLTQINLHFMNASLGDWVSEFGKGGAFSQVHVSPMVFWLHCTHYCAVDCHKPNQSSWSSILSSCWQVTVSIVLFHFCAWLPVAVRRTCECQMTFASEQWFFCSRTKIPFCFLFTEDWLFSVSIYNYFYVWFSCQFANIIVYKCLYSTSGWYSSISIDW